MKLARPRAPLLCPLRPLLAALLRCLSLLLLALACGRAAAADRLELAPLASAWTDASHQLTVDAVRRQDSWQPAAGAYLNYGFSDAAHWLRFRLPAGAGLSAPLLLQLASTSLDEVDLYHYRGETLLAHLQSGTGKPVALWPLPHRQILLPILDDARPDDVFYLRLRSMTAIQTQLSLWERDAFWLHDQPLLALNSLYYGAMLFIIFYHLILFLRLRDRAYLAYVFTVLPLLGIQLWMDGLGAQMLWPHQPVWNDLVPIFLGPLLIVSYHLFLNTVLHLRELSRSLSNWAMGAIALGTTGLLAVPLLPVATTLKVLPVLVLGAAGSALLIAYRVWYLTRQRYALIIALSVTTFVLGCVANALRVLDIVPPAAWSNHTMMLGSVLEVLLLAYALSERLGQMEQQRIDAERRINVINEQLLAAERRNRGELEQQVQQRTLELTAAVSNVHQLNLKLAELSFTDALTGARNRRHFDAELAAGLHEAAREGSVLSLVILDIDHFKVVNDSYGHPVGDDCLRQLADTIRAELRSPPDQVCRIGGEELALLLPGATLEAACAVAERIRLAIACRPIVSGHHSFHVSASFGVAASAAGDDDASLFAAADQALYRAKQGGRNRVCASTPPGAMDASRQAAR